MSARPGQSRSPPRAVLSVCLPTSAPPCRVRCGRRAYRSAGLSLRSFAIWLVAAGLLLIHAWIIGSDVFVALEVGSLIAIVVILLLALKYRGKSCRAHK